MASHSDERVSRDLLGAGMFEALDTTQLRSLAARADWSMWSDDPFAVHIVLKMRPRDTFGGHASFFEELLRSAEIF